MITYDKFPFDLADYFGEPYLAFDVTGNPVSENHLYGTRGRIRFMTAAGRKYQEAVRLMVEDCVECKGGVYMVEMTYHFGDKRRRDVTNYDKATSDALTGVVWEDDSQIAVAVLRKGYDKGNALTNIRIWRVENE